MAGFANTLPGCFARDERRGDPKCQGCAWRGRCRALKQHIRTEKSYAERYLVVRERIFHGEPVLLAEPLGRTLQELSALCDSLIAASVAAKNPKPRSTKRRRTDRTCAKWAREQRLMSRGLFVRFMDAVAVRLPAVPVAPIDAVPVAWEMYVRDRVEASRYLSVYGRDPTRPYDFPVFKVYLRPATSSIDIAVTMKANALRKQARSMGVTLPEVRWYSDWRWASVVGGVTEDNVDDVAKVLAVYAGEVFGRMRR